MKPEPKNAIGCESGRCSAGSIYLPPRLIRLRDTPGYLGIDRNKFNKPVRPCLTEIPLGAQAVAFDRIDLDAWADEYIARNGRPGLFCNGGALWNAKKPPGLVRRGGVWYIDKRIGRRRVFKSTGADRLEEAERVLARIIEEARKAQLYGVRPAEALNRRRRNSCWGIRTSAALQATWAD